MSRINFKLVSDKMITVQEALAEQVARGYDPRGYGFYRFEVTKIGTQFVATWNCSGSCD